MRVGRLALVCALLVPGVASADDKTTCIAAFDEAQRLRDERRLIEARAQFLQCAREVCPGLLRVDCSKSLTDIDTSLPTITLSASDGHGNDLAAVTVSIDGKPLATTLDGKAVEVDPGPHTFRFEVPGKPPMDKKVVVGQGEHNRRVAAMFAESPTPVRAVSADASAIERRTTVTIVGSVATGTAGLAAAVGASYFWATGMSDVNALRSGCGTTHSCAQNAVNAAHDRLLAGDITAAAGIVTVVVGTLLILVRPPEAGPPTAGAPRGSLACGAVPAGGLPTLGWSF